LIALIRIDDRLIHGQITTAWMSFCGAKRIVIASDDVAKDEMRKMVVDATAPKGTKVLDLKAAAEFLKSNPEKHFVICTNPTEALTLAQEGVEFDTVIVGNIGGLEQDSGAKKRIGLSKSVFVCQEDIEAFQKLRELGINSHIRIVPKDRPVNIYPLLDKNY
jgi:mannose/fructose/N-acetylgalactosamine-specific phosphotransferase system component IIB